MTAPTFTSLDLVPLGAAIVLSVGAILLILSEVFLSSGSRGYQPVLAVITSAVAGVLAVVSSFEPPREVFGGFGVLDPFSSLISAVVCVTAGLVSLYSGGFLRARGAERGEFYGLVLFAAAGMSLLAMSNELITLFVNLEILSVATYALASYLRRGRRGSEAGFKYFILGAFSSAILLYGAALLYGATGTTRLSEMAGPLAQAATTNGPLLLAGVLLISTGFAFKVAAVPFHMWTPDVYEGSPTPVAALMSAGVKAAALAAFIRVLMALSPGLSADVLVTMVGLLAMLTMIVGNLLAMPQRSVKRMLAYSSIAHAGYALLGVAVLFAGGKAAGEGFSLLGPSGLLERGELGGVRAEALRGILFYLLAYTVSAVGAFGVLGALERREEEERGTAWDLERFSGLAQRRPGWAFAMALFMLSLGGIPPTVGFMGKLLIFRSAVDAGLIGLAIVGVLSSVAGIYYYLRVVIHMYMRPAPEGAPTAGRSWSVDVAVALCTVAVLVLGLLPGSLGTMMDRAGILWIP